LPPSRSPDGPGQLIVVLNVDDIDLAEPPRGSCDPTYVRAWVIGEPDVCFEDRQRRVASRFSREQPTVSGDAVLRRTHVDVSDLHIRLQRLGAPSQLAARTLSRARR
jgi:hypothetical protein